METTWSRRRFGASALGVGAALAAGELALEATTDRARADTTTGDYQPLNIAGTLVQRPSVSAVAMSTVFFATDVNGGTAYISNGSTWTQMTAGVNSTGSVLCESSTKKATALNLAAGKWINDPDQPTMTIPQGSGYRLVLDTAISWAQGTVPAGAAVSCQLQIVDVATASTVYLYEVLSLEFASASGSGGNLTMPVHVETESRAALPSDKPVMLRYAFGTQGPNLSKAYFFNGYGHRAKVMRAIAA